MDRKKTNEISEIDTVEVPEFVYESLQEAFCRSFRSTTKATKVSGLLPNGKRRKTRRKAALHKDSGRITMLGSPPVFSFTNLRFLRYKQ